MQEKTKNILLPKMTQGWLLRECNTFGRLKPILGGTNVLGSVPMPWKRQHAIQIAAQLPPNPTDARMVLDYARDLFLGLHLTIFFGMRNRMNLPNLVTAQEVIAQLGGIKGVRQLTGSDYQRVWNWKAFGRFPARTYVLMSAELRRRGFTATTDLWSFDKRDRPPNQPPKRHRKKGKRQ